MQTVPSDPSDPVAFIVRHLLAPAPLRVRAAGEIRAVADQGVMDDVLHVLVRQRLIGTGGTRILNDFPELINATQRGSIEASLASGRDRALLAELLIEDLQRSFTASGIAAVPLKGPTLARRVLGDATQRAFSDLDFLVDAKRLEDAARLVEAAGWLRAEDPVDRQGRPLLHFSLVDSGRGLPAVELHWRIHWVESAFAQAALARRTVEGTLEAHDELLALLVFHARDGLQGLRYPTDIAAWLETYGAELDPARFRALLASHPELAPAARAGLNAVRETVGLPPGPVELLGLGPPSRRETLAARIASPFPTTDDDDLRATIALVNYLLAPWKVALHLVVRIVFAPRAGVEHRFPSPSAAMNRGLAVSVRNVSKRIASQTRILASSIRGS